MVMRRSRATRPWRTHAPMLRPAVVLALLIGPLVTTAPYRTAGATTLTTPPKQHAWQAVRAGGTITARAFACPTCPAALELACTGDKGSGLLELALPVAGVANGRDGASKQMRFIIGDTVLQRRAETRREDGHFVPHVALAADDALLDRMAAGSLLETSFYGQRAYVGLGPAAHDAIAIARAACAGPGVLALGPTGIPQLCTWHVALGCHPTEIAASKAGRAYAGATVLSHGEAGWCLAAVINDLAAARALFGRHGTGLTRSCVRLHGH